MWRGLCDEAGEASLHSFTERGQADRPQPFSLRFMYFPLLSLSSVFHVLSYLGEGNGTPLQYSCLEWGAIAFSNKSIRIAKFKNKETKQKANKQTNKNKLKKD